MFGSQTIRRRCPSLLQTSSWTSADAQGYFSATILVLVALDGFTFPLFYAVRPERRRAPRFSCLNLKRAARFCSAPNPAGVTSLSLSEVLDAARSSLMTKTNSEF